MSNATSMSLEELVRALEQSGARLPFEVGAFVALEICEGLMESPGIVVPAEVRIGDDGVVSVQRRRPGSAADAARSVGQTLTRLLNAAGPGVPPRLSSLAEKGPAGGAWDLGRLRDEIEAMLLPLNRGASRRILARTLREARRHVPAGGGLPKGPPSRDELDAALDALVDSSAEAVTRPVPRVPAAPAFAAPASSDLDAELDALVAAPSPPRAAPQPMASSPGDDVDRLLDELPLPADLPGSPRAVSPEPPSEPPTSREMIQPKPAARPVERKPVRVGPPAGGRTSARGTDRPGNREPLSESAKQVPAMKTPAPAPRDEPSDTGRISRSSMSPDGERSGGSGRAVGLGLLFLTLIAGLVGGVFYFRPDVIDRIAGRVPAGEEERAERERLAREEERRAQIEAHRGRFGELSVTSTPERAQVLLYVGRGPAVANNLPQGVAHEFVVIADGRAPTRALVPKDATWETTPDGPRYELAMQAGETETTFEQLDLGATRLPSDVGHPGALGSVRVVTAPPGAKVYQLIGFTPDVRVADMETEEAIELVVFAEGHVPQRIVVGPSDWVERDGHKTAAVEVTLVPRADAGPTKSAAR